jgi:hypothetical protein
MIYCIWDGDNWTGTPNGPGVDNPINDLEQLANVMTQYVDGADGS